MIGPFMYALPSIVFQYNGCKTFLNQSHWKWKKVKDRHHVRKDKKLD
jgi:hypothetical protein